MSKRPDLSRTSTQGIDAPVKVVGFHVEGTSPSPSSDTVLKEAVKSGSLSPVIIPPSFQVRVLVMMGEVMSCCVPLTIEIPRGEEKKGNAVG